MCDKRQYTEDEARKILDRIMVARILHQNINRNENRYYYCKYCGSFHITSSPKNRGNYDNNRM